MTKGTVRSVPMLVLLSIVTCGIYYLYWIYKTTDEIKNFMGREDINPALELILVLVTCNIYSLYWYYKYGKIVYLEMTKKGDLPAVKVGRRFLYLRSALEEWKNKNFYSPVWQKVKVKNQN